MAVTMAVRDLPVGHCSAKLSTHYTLLENGERVLPADTNFVNFR